MPLFKIWSCQRDKKALFFVNKDLQNVYEDLLLKASAKFQTDGEKLVLEKDGTMVDDDDVLWELSTSSEILILLAKNEVWTPDITMMSVILPPSSSYSSVSDTSTLASTLTNVSSNQSLPFFDEEAASNSTLQIEVDTIRNNEFELLDNDAGVNHENRTLLLGKASTTSNEFMWTNYTVPWSLIPAYMLDSCQKGIRDRHVISIIVHTIVDNVRKIKYDIPSKAFRILAKKMIDKYPETFRDIDEDGVVLGDGTYSLFTKLKERNNYLNRPHKRTNSTSPSAVSPKQIKKIINARAGCTEWQPEPSTSKENNESSEDKNSTDTSTDEDFLKTYSEQRLFLNNVENPPTLKDIKNKFPDFTKTRNMFKHFEKLTGVDIKAAMNGIQSKYDKILQFGQTAKHLNPTMTSPSDPKMLEVISKYFKEDINSIFKQVKNISDLTEPSPCIVEMKNENDNERKICVCMEKGIVDEEGHSSFLEALALLFALYFNLNLQYPKPFSTTMEMIQRYYLKIHPDSGSKSRKTSVSKKKGNFSD